MKTALILLAFVGVAFGASITPLASTTLPEAIEEIGEVVNATAVREIVSWYIENDPAVQAIVDSLGSDNFRRVVLILEATPPVVEHIHWINSTGVPILEIIHEWNDRFNWTLGQNSTVVTPITRTWNDMIAEIREVITEDVLEELKELIEVLVDTNPEFDEYIQRTLKLRPLFEELNETEPFLAVGEDFRALGVDVDAALERLGEYLDFLESLYNVVTIQ